MHVQWVWQINCENQTFLGKSPAPTCSIRFLTLTKKDSEDVD